MGAAERLCALVEPVVGEARRVVGVLTVGAAFVCDGPSGRARVALQVSPSLTTLRWTTLPMSPSAAAGRERGVEGGEVPIAALTRLHVEAAGGGAYILQLAATPGTAFPLATLLAPDRLQAADWVTGLTLLHRLLA